MSDITFITYTYDRHVCTEVLVSSRQNLGSDYTQLVISESYVSDGSDKKRGGTVRLSLASGGGPAFPAQPEVLSKRKEKKKINGQKERSGEKKESIRFDSTEQARVIKMR